MKIGTTRYLLFTVILLFSLSAQAQADELLATTPYNSGTNPNTLVALNPSTGAQTAVGQVGATNADSIAYDPQTAILYGADWEGGGSATMRQINMSSGQTTSLGTIQTGIESLAFNSNGTLYGWSISTDSIGTINLSNLNFTPVFSTPSSVNDVSIAFSPSNANILYANYWTYPTAGAPGFQDLVTINTATESVIGEIPVTGGLAVDEMTFSPDGSTIYFTNFSYFIGSMDPTTGTETSIGEGNIGDLSGIAWVTSSSVPEPTTMLLFGLGLIGVAGAKRKFTK